MQTTTTMGALADVFRDAVRTGEHARARDRAIAASASVGLVVVVAVVGGVAWGLVVLLAGLCAVVTGVAVRHRLPDVPKRSVAATRGSGWAGPGGSRRRGEVADPLAPAVQLGTAQSVYLPPEMVRVYPNGAFGPAEGVLFTVPVVNDGPKSRFRARLRPLGAPTPAAEVGDGFEVAWADEAGTSVEIRRGARRDLRVAACYQHGSRRLLRIFAPSARVDRGAVGPRSYSVAADREIPPAQGSLAFTVAVFDLDGVEVASGRFVISWDEILSDSDEVSLPVITAVS
ncbi:MAG: hypothetical protein RIE08_03800 [Acidimicrobiales bacterium]